MIRFISKKTAVNHSVRHWSRGMIAWAALLAAFLTTGPALTPAVAKTCPTVTVADIQGLKGAYPQQFELAEFDKLTGCQMTFSQNPAMAELNKRIGGNPETLPPVEKRLPEEPLVVGAL